jgi:REP element-mobilizing transposase RayT
MPHYHGRNLRTGRVSIPGQIYLVTTVTWQRLSLFRDFYQGRIVVDSLRRMERADCVESLAFVVMPDHLHWLFSLKASYSLSATVGQVKRCSAYRLNRLRGKAGQPVWQRGFHDRALRQEESIRTTARYLVANPLRAGLAAHIGDYALWDAVWL